MFCLQHTTSSNWAPGALDQLDALLVDHAHCELKAASNALSLAPRFYDFPQVVTALVALAQEELTHFELLLTELNRRQLNLGVPPVDSYAATLRKRSAQSCPGDRLSLLADRLLVGALIEARSCERFQLLSEEAKRRDWQPEATLYADLMASEARHYTTLRSLALDVTGDEAKGLSRLEQLAAIEATLNAAAGSLPAIHG